MKCNWKKKQTELDDDDVFPNFFSLEEKKTIKKNVNRWTILDCVGSSCPFDDVEQSNSSSKVRIPSKHEIISLSFKSNQYERRWL